MGLKCIYPNGRKAGKGDRAEIVFLSIPFALVLLPSQFCSG